MARGKLSPEEVRLLRENCYVSDVAEDRVCYTNEFKFRFIEEYMAGKKPTQIFKEAGFDPKILGSKRIERAAKRWKESYEAGSLGSYKDRVIRRKEDQYLKLLREQQALIEKLHQENTCLKEQLAKCLAEIDVHYI